MAAGYSSRMKRFKPLMRFGDMAILERGIRLFQTVGIEDIRVVVGYRCDDIIKTLKPLGIRWLYNRQYQSGMFSSVVTGIKSLEPDKEAFFILPADIPLVKRQTVFDLLAAHQVGKGRILHPCFKGKRGHPPLISTAYSHELIRWNGKRGLKSFMEKYESDAVNIEVADEGILLDLDTPADYQKLINRYKSYKIPITQQGSVLKTNRFTVVKEALDHGVSEE
jgi:CTP:molybdopterin cytidylyltransferase MocA